MQTEMRGSTELQLTIKRPVLLVVDVSQSSETRVLPVTSSAGATSLVVTSACDSVVAGANGLEEFGIVAGDRIIAVNGRRGSAAGLLRELRSRTAWRLLISRRLYADFVAHPSDFAPMRC
mmetsp:Transcript_56344/g.158036  ORF Transcript_56344/g.158036 Transcript_56344/m.158036 type:complete len:120 (+) Transcript_56344:519-878(+)